MFGITEKAPSIFSRVPIRLLVFLQLSTGLIALALLPTAFNSGGPKYLVSWASFEDGFSKHEANSQALSKALDLGVPLNFRGRTIAGAGPFWEVRSGPQSYVISVRDGKQTAIKMPIFQKVDNITWAGEGSLLNKDGKFLISISPGPCGREFRGHQGSGTIWIKFDDLTRDRLEGCVFLEEQAHDYPSF